MPLPGRHIVLGVSGGIAAYKSCLLVRRLQEAGATVEVVMTRGARRFVRPVTFEALSGRPVHTSLWRRGQALDHIALARRADLLIVAPATANLLARAALGIADDLLSAVLLARQGPVLVAPAMNDRMYADPATRQNLAALQTRGWAQVGPAVGPLAEGDSDLPGRMSEPETIVAHAARVLGGATLAGRRVVVTAGPTREAIDPVRVITNRSSGKMGYRLAEAAWQRGAEVLLISGPSAEPLPEGVAVERIESTEELEAAVRAALPGADILLMAAAPGDFRVARPAAGKLERASGKLTLALEPTGDILSGTRDQRPPGMVAVGFALETGSAEARARDKLARKALDLIVVNDALEPGAGFEVDTNRVVILDAAGGRVEVPLQSKAGVAAAILDVVEDVLGRRTAQVSGTPA